jgi:ABC-type cobalamin/Fe3+-siderophores transport system ATPase subunit
MKHAKILSLLLALMLISNGMQAQVTPQAIIGNAPGLPTPQQWAANKGHTEAFKAKIDELDGKVNAMQSAAASVALQAANRQAQQQQQMAAQGQQRMDAMGITDADLKKMQGMSEKEAQAFMMQKMQKSPQMQSQMAVFDALGITEADMKKMEKMNDKQNEAFIKQRMKERGITEEGLAQIVVASGGQLQMLSPEEMQEMERREQQDEALGKAMQKEQETREAYLHQLEVTNKKIDEAKKLATDRIAALPKPKFEQTGGPEEVMKGAITAAAYEAVVQRNRAKENDYRAEVYKIWSEYVGTAQGHLKFLLPYAQAYEDAAAAMASVNGSAAIVATRYLGITKSEPSLDSNY